MASQRCVRICVCVEMCVWKCGSVKLCVCTRSCVRVRILTERLHRRGSACSLNL